jgi:hypothetical protein
MAHAYSRKMNNTLKKHTTIDKSVIDEQLCTWPKIWATKNIYFHEPERHYKKLNQIGLAASVQLDERNDRSRSILTKTELEMSWPLSRIQSIILINLILSSHINSTSLCVYEWSKCIRLVRQKKSETTAITRSISIYRTFFSFDFALITWTAPIPLSSQSGMLSITVMIDRTSSGLST